MMAPTAAATLAGHDRGILRAAAVPFKQLCPNGPAFTAALSPNGGRLRRSRR
jgi:hypothetical protein